MIFTLTNFRVRKKFTNFSFCVVGRLYTGTVNFDADLIEASRELKFDKSYKTKRNGSMTVFTTNSSIEIS